MKSLKISTLVKLILVTLCFTIIIISSFAFKSMHQANISFGNIDFLMKDITELRQMSSYLANVRGDINFVHNDTAIAPEVLDRKAIVIKSALDNARKHVDIYNNIKALDDEGDKLAADIYNNALALIEAYTANMKSIAVHNNHGFNNGALETALDKAILAYELHVSELQDNISAKFESDSASFTIIAALLLALAIIISCVSYFIIKKNVFSRLQIASSMLEKIGTGELYHEFDIGARNEIGTMFESLKKMKTSISKIITSVRSTAENIRNDASEIDSSNHNLASRTEEQASALQQTAASMEEIKTTVSNNAENARQANTLTHQAKTAANSGSAVMSDVVNTMDKISQSARKISEINRVIDGIANQTNILALNAAVEAARAGEQGRGFSVVATEVRNLAKRSADAAKEINQLINESVKNVDDGAKLIEDAGKAMQEIVTSVTHVSNIMQEITQASEEQSTGVSQIAMAVNEMDLATQQNATMVEESSIITQNMNQNAKQLADIVSVFKVELIETANENNQKEVTRKKTKPHNMIAKESGVKKHSLATATDDEWAEF
ncbi:methyl-accepting chemotaxis protein [Yersinia vastinensis]|uniref:methyl-accepting chemotaxis protein n=2 Tax=Yersinia vastinensis TaxID=2890318 RepID=UPI00119EB516|nr:methyl-accepting chemotaxis protein [Yersinia vastinensis]